MYSSRRVIEFMQANFIYDCTYPFKDLKTNIDTNEHFEIKDIFNCNKNSFKTLLTDDIKINNIKCFINFYTNISLRDAPRISICIYKNGNYIYKYKNGINEMIKEIYYLYKSYLINIDMSILTSNYYTTADEIYDFFTSTSKRELLTKKGLIQNYMSRYAPNIGIKTVELLIPDNFYNYIMLNEIKNI